MASPPMILIATFHCREYATAAQAYIATDADGRQRLIVKYDKGGRNRAREFAAGIPPGWSVDDVLNRLFGLPASLPPGRA